LLGFVGCGVRIGKLVYEAVQRDAFLYATAVSKFLLTFYKITNHIARKYFGLVKRQVSVCEIIHSVKFISIRQNTKSLCAAFTAGRKLISLLTINNIQ